MCCVDIPGVCFGDGFCFDTAFAALVSLLLSCAKLTQGDVLLFFFTEKKKKKQKKKSSRLPFFCTAMYYTDGSVTAIRLHITKIPRRGYRQLVCRDTVLF